MNSSVMHTLAIVGSAAVAATTLLVSMEAKAQKVPAWHPEHICAEDSDRGHCLLLEREARNDIRVSWGLLPDAVRADCLTRFTPPLEPSWRLLGDCIEIEGRRALQIRVAAKEKYEEAALNSLKSQRAISETPRQAESTAGSAKARPVQLAQQQTGAAGADLAEEERKRIEAEEASFMATLDAQRKADAEAARLKAETKKAAEAKAADEERKRIEAEEASFMATLDAQRKADAEAARLKAEAKKAAEAKAADEERKRIEAEEASFMATLDAQRKADAEAARLKAEADKAGKATAQQARQAAAKSCSDRLKEVDAQGMIQFQLNSADLDPAVDTAVLDTLAKVAGDCEGELSIIVEGHTDSLGTVDGNERLSQARAETIAAYLREKGVPAERVQAKGYGSSKPIASNRTRAGRQQNRRIEFKVE